MPAHQVMAAPHSMTRKKPGAASGRRKSIAGFTLLEAILALALVAIAVMPLYGFFSRSLDGLYRAATVNRESEVSLSAIAFLTGLNPMERPEGESPLGAYRLRWRSQELVPATDITSYPRGLGLYQAALYEVTGELFEGQRVRTTVTIRLVGFKRVRELLPFAAPAAPTR
jgi:general secretion pathway protein I